MRRLSGRACRHSKVGADFMSGRLPFGELTKGFSKERRDRIEAIKAELVAELPVQQEPFQQEGRLAGE